MQILPVRQIAEAGETVRQRPGTRIFRKRHVFESANRDLISAGKKSASVQRNIEALAAECVDVGARRAGGSEQGGSQKVTARIKKAQIRLEASLSDGGSGSVDAAAIAERDGLHRGSGADGE